jgi:hypothetical protein
MLLYIDESGYTGEDRQFNTKVLRIVFVSMLIKSICIVPWRPKTQVQRATCDVFQRNSVLTNAPAGV